MPKNHAPPKKWVVWTGRILSALPALIMLLSGTMKLLRIPQVVATWEPQFGYPLSTLTPIGLVEVGCVVIYAVPRTAVLGTILVSGYLTAAFATHLRIGDPG